jgi:hypothetical protein
MEKTSVYLSDSDRERLQRLARLEGVSQAEVIRRAIARYVPRARPACRLRLTASFDGPGDSVAAVPEEELLRDLGP